MDSTGLQTAQDTAKKRVEGKRQGGKKGVPFKFGRRYEDNRGGKALMCRNWRAAVIEDTQVPLLCGKLIGRAKGTSQATSSVS